MSKRIDELLHEEDAGKTYVSYEFYPPRSQDVNRELMNSHIPQLVRQSPLFFDVTWGAGGATKEKTKDICLQLSTQYPSIPVNMHITCTSMTKIQLLDTLDFAKKNNIRNIFALRGDPPEGMEFEAVDGLSSAADMVRYIRENYGDYFCITVAGYPEGHPSRIDGTDPFSEEIFKRELEFLQEKVDAGANLIITQLFCDAQLFIDFVKRCRAAGITVPILPGMLLLTSYKSLMRMLSITKTFVGEEVRTQIEALKDDSEAFSQYGVTLTAGMIKKIQEANIGVHHFHFFTMNDASPTLNVLKEMNLLQDENQENEMQKKSNVLSRNAFVSPEDKLDSASL